MYKSDIKIPKLFFGRSKDPRKDRLARLEKTVIKIASKNSKYGFYDPSEEDFLEKNKGKMVILKIRNKREVQGILESIDKYRIVLTIDQEFRYYYKHAIISYYRPE